MLLLLLIPAILSLLALAAHWLRDANYPMVLLFLAVCLLLALVQRPWVKRLTQIVLVIGFFIWIHTAWNLAQDRMNIGQPWLRGFCILAGVGIFALISAALLQFHGPRSQSRR
jgi:hypothetical protein